MLGPFPEGREKRKMGPEQSSVSGEIETGDKPEAPFFEIGADSIGVDPKEAKKAEVQAAIEDKTKLATSLRATINEKFQAFKRMRQEFDAEQATMTRLKIAGKLNLSEADMTESKRFGMAKINELGDEIAKYRKDAEELEKEIETLNAELGKDRN